MILLLVAKKDGNGEKSESEGHGWKSTGHEANNTEGNLPPDDFVHVVAVLARRDSICNLILGERVRHCGRLIDLTVSIMRLFPTRAKEWKPSPRGDDRQRVRHSATSTHDL